MVGVTAVLAAGGFRPASGSSSPPWLWVPVAAFMAVVFVLSIVQYRRRGPAVGWVPRRFRARVNAWYLRHDLPQPYDHDGNKVQPWWTKRSEN